MPDAELPPDVATVDTAAEPALTAFSDEDAASDVLSDAAELFPETAASLQPARLSAVMPAMAQMLIILVFIRIFYLPPDDVNEDKNDLRLVFEIEHVSQLFDDYKKVKLEIWRTFTDTTLDKILC